MDALVAPSGEQGQASDVGTRCHAASELANAVRSVEADEAHTAELCARRPVARSSGCGTFNSDPDISHLAYERRLEKSERSGDDIRVDIAEHATAADHVMGVAVRIASVAARPENVRMQHPVAAEISDGPVSDLTLVAIGLIGLTYRNAVWWLLP